MGQRGSDVSREVADLVLLDDNFATIVDAIAEGRSIYENIQKFIRTLFSTNLSECLLIGGGALFAFTLAGLSGAELILPLTAVQILWINLLTDSLPALAITTDQNRNMMSLPPRDPNEPLLDARSFKFILALGLVGGAIALTALFVLPVFGLSAAQTQSWVFSFVVFVQLSFVFPARQVRMASERNYWVVGAVSLCFLIQILAVFLPAVQHWLGTQSLPASSIIVMLLVASIAGITAHLYAGYLRKTA
jgi:Ca2+-transporting ATPase